MVLFCMYNCVSRDLLNSLFVQFYEQTAEAMVKLTCPKVNITLYLALAGN